MMKTVLSLTFLFLFTNILQAQCTVSAADFGNNNAIPMYNVSGAVSITLNSNGTSLTLDLGTDFMTAAGPDIRAFLVNPGTLNDTQLKTTPIGSLENIPFGLVGSGTVNQNGAKTFTVDIPAGRDITAYTKIFFYCLQFDQFWDFGTFEAFTPANCGILGTQDVRLNAINFSPNPAKESITITNSELASISISIFNTFGQKLIELKPATIASNIIDVSNFSAGVYLVEISLDKERRVEQLIKQ